MSQKFCFGENFGLGPIFLKICSGLEKIIQKSEPVLKILFRLKVCGITLSEASSVSNITIVHDDIQIHMLSAVCSNGVEQTMKSPLPDGAGEGR